MAKLHDKTTYMRRNRPPAASLPTLELAVEQKEEKKHHLHLAITILFSKQSGE
jgi:hypothetical protein